MSTFSATVTKAQRDARDFDSRGREISICSRQHTKRPGYNPSPYEPQKLKSKPSITNTPSITGLVNTILEEGKNKALAIVQVRPNTKRGNKGTVKHKRLDTITFSQFYDAGCEYLHNGSEIRSAKAFTFVRQEKGDVCTTGCGWFDDGKCPTYITLCRLGETS